MLMSRVNELEMEIQSVRQASDLTFTLKDELSHILCDGGTLCSGPDSLEHLRSFSLANVISEVQRLAPNLYSLLCDLGDTEKNATDDDISAEEGPSVTLCFGK